MTATTTNAVAKRASEFTEDVLREINSWDDLSKFVTSSNILVERIESYGANLTVVNKSDKDALIGKPLMIVDYRFSTGDQGRFVSVVLMTKFPISIDGRDPVSKFVVNDGSTGILAQIDRIEAERLRDGTDTIRPLYVEKGLRKSDYDRKDENGQPILNPQTGQVERATTYYFHN